MLQIIIVIKLYIYISVSIIVCKSREKETKFHVIYWIQFYTGLKSIGAEDPFTILNVLGEDTTRGYCMMDSLGTGKIPADYYKDNELGIGAQINVFGRRIVITDMDGFTKEYYR